MCYYKIKGKGEKMEEEKKDLKEQVNTAVEVIEKPEIIDEQTNQEIPEKKKKSKLGLIIIISIIILAMLGILSTIFAVINIRK